MRCAWDCLAFAFLHGRRLYAAFGAESGWVESWTLTFMDRCPAA